MLCEQKLFLSPWTRSHTAGWVIIEEFKILH